MLVKFRIDRNTITNNSTILNANDNHLIYSNLNDTDINSKIFDAVNGEISAKKLADELFPENEPHIFISHSSKDVNVAISLANTLYAKYKITSFIDSQLWGHIDHALKEMHNRYCKIPGSSYYHYDKSNNLLSHMHAILSMALMRVMDNADSVIFIESGNSIYQYMGDTTIAPQEAIEKTSETLSPWISSEVNFANTLRLKGHKDREQPLMESTDPYSLNKSNIKADSLPKIIHEVNLSKFIEIDNKKFKESLSLNETNPIKTLDMIYQIYAQ
ncbi:hypothetical protein [Escherichia coli]|uniref:hypothetical protein n=1 Tax=Escherichia coli TaxID=562 RepID=UPI0015EEA125|nr:hypothetical protein [Escherichia coli]